MPKANYLPSEQQVLTFIADTIDWYRHLPTAQRIGATPADLLFIEDNRAIATNIVRLSFEFGKAMVVIDPPQNSPEPETTPVHWPSPASNRRPANLSRKRYSGRPTYSQRIVCAFTLCAASPRPGVKPDGIMVGGD
jgi:hypothetical protein